MNNIKTHKIIVLIMITVGSICNINAKGTAPIYLKHENSSFIGKMHHIENELNILKHDAKNNDKTTSLDQLAEIKTEIDELENKQTDKEKESSLRKRHFKTLRKEFNQANEFIKKHSKADSKQSA